VTEERANSEQSKGTGKGAREAEDGETGDRKRNRGKSAASYVIASLLTLCNAFVDALSLRF